MISLPSTSYSMLHSNRFLSTLVLLLTGLISVSGLMAQPRDFRDNPNVRDNRDIRYNPYIRPANFPAEGDYERREIVKDLLEDLIQQEQKRNRISSPYGRSVPLQPDARISSNDYRNIRQAIEDFSQEADRLTASLYKDSQYEPSVRAHMSDMMKVRARSVILSDRVRSTQDLQTILPEIGNLDQTWRLLSFQLGQLRNLSTASVNSIKRMNSDIVALGKITKIGPQLDRAELIRETAAVGTSLRSLLDDINLELGNTSQARTLLLEGRKIEQQTRYLSSAVSEYQDYQTVLGEYRQFERMWNGYVDPLWQLNNRYIERSIQRINNADGRLRKLLYLSNKLNTQELLHATTLLMRDVDEFFVRAPLKLLIELPRGNNVIATADQFYGVCQNFADVVQRGERYEDMVDAYSYIDDAWIDFHETFRPMNSQAAHQVLQQIEKSMHALKDKLGVKSGFDYQMAISKAASLETLAEHLDEDIQRWLQRDRVRFAAQCLRESNTFLSGCRKLHRDLLTGASTQQLQSQTNTLLESWQMLNSYVMECRTNERNHLLRIAGHITPSLVDLQTSLVK